MLRGIFKDALQLRQCVGGATCHTHTHTNTHAQGHLDEWPLCVFRLDSVICWDIFPVFPVNAPQCNWKYCLNLQAAQLVFSFPLICSALLLHSGSFNSTDTDTTDTKLQLFWPSASSLKATLRTSTATQAGVLGRFRTCCPSAGDCITIHWFPTADFWGVASFELFQLDKKHLCNGSF